MGFLIYFWSKPISISSAEPQEPAVVFPIKAPVSFASGPGIGVSVDAKESIDSAGIDVDFNGKEIKIPALYLTDSSTISVGGLDASGKMFSLNGWTVKSVERKNKDDIGTFTATLTCQEASSFKYSDFFFVKSFYNLLN